MGMRIVIATAALAIGVSGCSSFGILDRSELVAAPQPCAETTLPIYFSEGQARLTRPAQTLIRTTAANMRGCTIDRVRVVGLASATGGTQSNLSLSERRAVVVAQALADAGLPTPAFEVIAAGDAGAEQGGVSEPVRRRVEVVIDARPHS